MRKTLSSSSSSRVLQRGASGVARSFSSSSPMPPLQTMQPQTLQTIRRNASIRTRQQSKRKNFYGAFYISVLVVTAVFVTTFFLSLQRRVNQTRTMTSMNASTIDEKNTIASREHRDMLPSIPEKEPILQLLRDAGILELDAESVDRLPTWAKVTELYGDKPIMYGLDTCKSFQTASDPSEHFLAVAGTFNSGTNLLSELLIQNCHMPARMAKYGSVHEGIRWQVPWGKHTPIDNENVRQEHKVASGAAIMADNVFPAVTIRDPAVWAASMCRHEYAMEWPHTRPIESDQHCPNFVPNDIDIALQESLRNVSSIPVLVKYAEFEREHLSMIHHWNEFFGAYYEQNHFPRLIIRFEDLIFHPKPVVQAVCECAGGKMKYESGSNGFKYIVQFAKKEGGHSKDKTGFVDAIIKYGSGTNRWNGGGMTEEDRRFAFQHLDRALMKTFGYQYPSTTSAEDVEQLALSQ